MNFGGVLLPCIYVRAKHMLVTILPPEAINGEHIKVHRPGREQRKTTQLALAISPYRRDAFERWLSSPAYKPPDAPEIFAPDYNAKRKSVAEKKMAAVDSMSPEMRKVVHEYGDVLVKQFIQQGVTQPQRIRHLIDFVRGYYADGRSAWVGDARTSKNF